MTQQNWTSSPKPRRTGAWVQHRDGSILYLANFEARSLCRDYKLISPLPPQAARDAVECWL